MSTSIETMDRSGPRLLFLAYFFPPMQIIAALRTANMAKQLARRGWQVSVVTPSPDHWLTTDRDESSGTLRGFPGVRLVYTGHWFHILAPYHLKCWNDRFGHFVGGIFRRATSLFDVEQQAGWLVPARAACRRFRKGEFDLILASGGPFVSFRLARELSERLDCPYVLDYRDLWTGNPHADRPHRAWTVKREQGILRRSRAVVAVSPSLRDHLEARFGVTKHTTVLWNGFDPQELEGAAPTRFDHFAIVYTGIFYQPVSTITPLMRALRIVEDKGAIGRRPWFFHYYGPQGTYVLDEARRFGLLEHVVDHGVVPRAASLSAVRGANVAVVITSVARRGTLAEKGIVTGKIFEPLGSGTPVLLIAPDDNDAIPLVRAAGPGAQVHGEDPEGIASFLRARMADPETRAFIPDAWSWDSLGTTLDNTLRKALELSPGHAH